ncbi:MAG TPA: UDP-N-acetylmuramate dehydrogenase [Myxococcales bacterium]|jgi:UDP-N-acetylmuramate dehydrogenase
MTLRIRESEPLASRTTLELGGPARFFAEVASLAEIEEAVRFARERGLRLGILGGGSNLLVADEGFDGLVAAISSRGRTSKPGPDGAVLVRAEAGESWDELVGWTVAQGWQGLECLSGIPGLVGSTPVQNVGAYGQEVADTIVEVEAYDRERGERRLLARAECGFGYRDSSLKRAGGRFVVSAVTFALRPGAPAPIRYGELQRTLGVAEERDLARVREVVLQLRRGKSMVHDASDPNRRSAGSFFTNPIVEASVADEVARRSGEASMPRWPQPDGRAKLAAGWLIERAGIVKGLREGHVGVSSAHALALVHHGGGTTRELLALADRVVGAVEQRFGVRLEREPVMLG